MKAERTFETEMERSVESEESEEREEGEVLDGGYRGKKEEQVTRAGRKREESRPAPKRSTDSGNSGAAVFAENERSAESVTLLFDFIEKVLLMFKCLMFYSEVPFD